MNIDWVHFSPWAALTGGIVLGVASAAFVLVNGRVLGISGILGGLLVPQRSDASWRVFFLLGLILAPASLSLIAPELVGTPRIDAGNVSIVAAGLLVGLGTRYGSGCTSGHGVCGLSRLSPRSLVATLAFMASGFATVYLIRHVLA
ncbi:MAG: YeeE/YedE family protein [Gammaproteobacteria bacterium]|nr:YeeE/YedE family protein [Gammaproteobacteria bacterium]